MASLRVADGPGSARAAATSRTKEAASAATRHWPRISTSGIAVETTGRPAARYSRTFSGLALSVSVVDPERVEGHVEALAVGGQVGVGHPAQQVDVGEALQGRESVVALPRTTSDPVEKCSATRAISSTSTQSAIRPKKPMTGRGQGGDRCRDPGRGIEGLAEMVEVHAVPHQDGVRILTRLGLVERLGRDDHQVGPAEEPPLQLGEGLGRTPEKAVYSSTQW